MALSKIYFFSLMSLLVFIEMQKEKWLK